MPNKKQNNLEIKEVQAPIAPLSPLFSNIIEVHTHSEIVVIDFGFVAPGYSEPYDIEATQIARICVPWSAIEHLSGLLNKAILDHNKKQILKIKKKSKT